MISGSSQRRGFSSFSGMHDDNDDVDADIDLQPSRLLSRSLEKPRDVP